MLNNQSETPKGVIITEKKQFGGKIGTRIDHVDSPITSVKIKKIDKISQDCFFYQRKTNHEC